MEKILQLERDDDQYFDELNGCRKGKNAPTPDCGHTGGVNGWFTANGFILKLKENVCRETTTEIIKDTFELFTASLCSIMFYQIMTIFGM